MIVSQQRVLESRLRGSYGRTDCRNLPDRPSGHNPECKVTVVTLIQRFCQMVAAAPEGCRNLPMGDAGPSGDVNSPADQMVTVRYAPDSPVVSCTPVGAGYPTIMSEQRCKRCRSIATYPIRGGRRAARGSFPTHRRRSAEQERQYDQRTRGYVPESSVIWHVVRS